MEAGRPSEYQPHFAEIAREACRQSGASYAKLGKLLAAACQHEKAFSKSTICAWCKAYPEFAAAIQDGQDEYNADSAETSLNKLVKGYTVTETTVEFIEVDPDANGDTPIIIDKAGNNLAGFRQIKRKKTKVGPNQRSIEFVLTHRRPERWPNKQQIEHGVSAGAADRLRSVIEGLYGEVLNGQSA